MSMIYDHSGRRKYLTRAEQQAFLRATESRPPEIRTFCLTLAYTGARVSEALALSAGSFDCEERAVIIECMKKRRPGTYRAVPVPEKLFSVLEKTHRIRQRKAISGVSEQRLWPWCRTTGWKHVKSCMAVAGITGGQATPKGLRHGFAIAALQAGLPLNMVKKWLGHSRLSTTAIYTDAIGDEERAIAARLWVALEPRQ